MYITVKHIDFLENGVPKELVINIPSNSTVFDIYKVIYFQWTIEPHDQKIFYEGRLLQSRTPLTELNLETNNVIHLIAPKKIIGDDLVPAYSKYYSDNQIVEVRCKKYNAWWPAKLITVKKYKSMHFNCLMSNEAVEKHLVFITRFYTNIFGNKEFVTKFDCIRPISTNNYQFDELELNMIVSVMPRVTRNARDRHRYDMKITAIDSYSKIIYGDLDSGNGLFNISYSLRYNSDILQIEKPKYIYYHLPGMRRVVMCMMCCNVLGKKCFFCACVTCGLKKDPFRIIHCEDCYSKFHYNCLHLPQWPREKEWYCSNCRHRHKIFAFVHTVGTNDRVQVCNSTDNNGSGRGMACVGIPKECTLVPVNHYGPIPGVDVGTRWKYRSQVAESGVHRDQNSGIHGLERNGVYSIMMSDALADDEDRGYEIVYYGLIRNENNNSVALKRLEHQLTGTNRALALNCNALFNGRDGSESPKWKMGKPIRVCRSSTIKKCSKYAPDDGIRYDGLYKVVKYFKEQYGSGHVWKFLLRRDDPSPAPWEKNGVEFDIIYPVGYSESVDQTQSRNTTKRALSPQAGTSKSDDSALPIPKKIKPLMPATVTSQTVKDGNSKEVNQTEQCMQIVPKVDNVIQKTKDVNSKDASLVLVPSTSKAQDEDKSESAIRFSKRLKEKEVKKGALKKIFVLDETIEMLIKKDVANKTLWTDCLNTVKKGKYMFILKVQEEFKCIVCQEVVFHPVTTCNQHNTCMKCLKQSFDANLYECPYCRQVLGYNYKMKKNHILNKILLKLLPGYEQNR